MAAMSVTVRNGFDGVSTQTIWGRALRIARVATSTSVRSTDSDAMPSAGLMTLSSLCVPPYTSVECTI